MKREIYLQFKFLVQFYQSKPDQNLLQLNQEQKLWWDFHHFLSENNLEVCIDLEYDRFKELSKEHPFLIYFLNLFEQGKESISLDTLPFEQLEEDTFYEKGSFCKFFGLDTEQENCKQKQEKYGFLFFNYEMLYKTIQKFSIKALEDNNLRLLKFGTNTEQGTPSLNSWADLKNYNHPINSLIICDRYLLNSEYGLTENLIPILKNLLNPDTTTDVLILGNAFKLNLGTIRDKIATALSSLKVNISICKIDLHDSHDRMIFTNYFHIQSGQSFCYFKGGQINKDIPATTLQFNSLFGQNSWLVASDFLREIKLTLPKQDKIGTEVIAVGNKQNRLL